MDDWTLALKTSSELLLYLLIPVDFCLDNSTEVATWCAHPFHFNHFRRKYIYIYSYTNYMVGKQGVSPSLIAVSGDLGCLAANQKTDLHDRLSYPVDCFLVNTENSIPFIKVLLDLYKCTLNNQMCIKLICPGMKIIISGDSLQAKLTQIDVCGVSSLRQNGKK